MDPVEELIDYLHQENREWRREAAVALGHTGDPRAVWPLILAFRVWDQDLYDCVVTSLLRLGEAAVMPLCEALRHQNRRIRIGAASTLGMIGSVRSVAPLCEALQDQDRFVRGLAAEALGKTGSSDAVGPLCKQVEDGIWEAAAALGRIGDRRAVPSLCEALQGEDRHLRRHAALALGRLHDVRAILPLCEALGQNSSYICCAVAAALGKIAARHPVRELRAAVPALRRLLAPWSFAGEEARLVYRATLAQIESATGPASNLPLPAEAPLHDAADRPIPAPPPDPSADKLPLPIRGRTC
jgi:HEAT repeat protein